MSEWRDIATAPKDGTEILGYGRVAGEISGEGWEVRTVILWEFDGESDFTGYNWRVAQTDGYALWMKATHWMPLPSPPTPGKQSGEG